MKIKSFKNIKKFINIKKLKNIKKFINNNILIIFLLIVFLISCIYNFLHDKKEKKTFSKKEYDYIHKVLLENFKKTAEIFDKHGFKYWASDGTLLGSVRDNGIIEYDDDIDISILKEDYMRLINDKKIHNDFNRSGLHLLKPNVDDSKINTMRIVKVVTKNELNDYTKNKIFIDIMPREKISNRYILSVKHARDMWPNSYFNDNELFPLKKNKFNNLTINIPNNPIPYLERVYGDCKHKPSRYGPCWRKKPNIGKPHHFKEINLNI